MSYFLHFAVRFLFGIPFTVLQYIQYFMPKDSISNSVAIYPYWDVKPQLAGNKARVGGF